MNKRFISFEGLDGCGKSTQAKMLNDYFAPLPNCKPYTFNSQCLHFPHYQSFLSEKESLIAKYLRGDFGKIDNPYFAATLFAIDRFNFKNAINSWLEAGVYVIADRYTYSSLAYSAAQMTTTHDQKKIIQDIEHLEYENLKIPKPGLTIFLNVSAEFVVNNLQKRRIGTNREHLNNIRIGINREYLDGRDDIYEVDLELQISVYEQYYKFMLNRDDFVCIDCIDGQGMGMLPPEEIHCKVIDLLKTREII